MSCRLDGFDYTKPYFYMVTLKKRPGLPPFSALAPGGKPSPRDAEGRECWLAPNGVTRAFAEVIRGFHVRWRGIAPIECFIVMPDHLHLLLKIEETPDRLPLGSYVVHLERALCRAFWETLGGTVAAPQDADRGPASESCGAATVPHVFEKDWHDWIVLKHGQLAAFTRYIRENPRRTWLRRENRRFFTRPGKLAEPFSREIFLMECRIAGTTHIEDVEAKTENLAEGSVLALRRDPDNEYDDRAISVLAPGGARIGWIPQERNEVVSRLMDAGKLLYAKVQSKAWNPGGTWLMIDISLYMRDT